MKKINRFPIYKFGAVETAEISLPSYPPHRTQKLCKKGSSLATSLFWPVSSRVFVVVMFAPEAF